MTHRLSAFLATAGFALAVLVPQAPRAETLHMHHDGMTPPPGYSVDFYQ